MKLTPYQRIIRAQKEGRGVRLSLRDCINLSLDDAITTRALMDDANQDGKSDEDYWGRSKDVVDDTVR